MYALFILHILCKIQRTNPKIINVSIDKHTFCSWQTEYSELKYIYIYIYIILCCFCEYESLGKLEQRNTFIENITRNRTFGPLCLLYPSIGYWPTVCTPDPLSFAHLISLDCSSYSENILITVWIYSSTDHPDLCSTENSKFWKIFLLIPVLKTWSPTLWMSSWLGNTAKGNNILHLSHPAP